MNYSDLAVIKYSRQVATVLYDGIKHELDAYSFNPDNESVILFTIETDSTPASVISGSAIYRFALRVPLASITLVSVRTSCATGDLGGKPISVDAYKTILNGLKDHFAGSNVVIE